jgi:hypothetical protein
MESTTFYFEGVKERKVLTMLKQEHSNGLGLLVVVVMVTLGVPILVVMRRRGSSRHGDHIHEVLTQHGCQQ